MYHRPINKSNNLIMANSIKALTKGIRQSEEAVLFTSKVWTWLRALMVVNSPSPIKLPITITKKCISIPINNPHFTKSNNNKGNPHN